MTLAEAGLPYELRHIDITVHEHRRAEYLSINPRGTIPALVDESGMIICETIAIMLYLSDRHALEHLVPVATDSQRGSLLDWLVYHAVEVQEPVKRSFYAHRHALHENDIKTVRQKANDVFTERWQLVEEHLSGAGPFHLGERFSIVDIYLLVTSTFSKRLAEGRFPAIEECIRLISQRPLIAPILKQHLEGLDRITKIGVPQ
jgi:glutathione S-transferase